MSGGWIRALHPWPGGAEDATGNTIAALAAGAQCASVTVNGLGEHAGNASLDEVVMAARLTLGWDCGVDTRQLAALSDLVSRASGRSLADTKPVVGSAVFRHESGIHCGGLLEDRATYEAFAAEEVGHAPTELVVGRHTGLRLLRAKLERLRLPVPAPWLPTLLEEIRHHARHHKTGLNDADLGPVVARFRQSYVGLQ